MSLEGKIILGQQQSGIQSMFLILAGISFFFFLLELNNSHHILFFFSLFPCINQILYISLGTLSGTVEVFYCGYGFKEGTWQRIFFLLDSGAMHDIIIDESLDLRDVEVNASIYMFLADGTCIVLDKKGKLDMSFCCGCHLMVLSNVLFSPGGFGSNLLSIGKATSFVCILLCQRWTESITFKEAQSVETILSFFYFVLMFLLFLFFVLFGFI